MAEASRTNSAERNLQDPAAAPEWMGRAGTPQLDRPELPAKASPASNPALNRSAETVGRSLGNAVAAAQNLPRQIDRLRSRIHVVPGREAAGTTASNVKDAALETAAEWRDAAEARAYEMRQKAESYLSTVADRTNDSLDELRREARVKTDRLRRRAQGWLAAARRMPSERPLVVVGACAAAAFTLGVLLRVRRSNCD